MIRMSLITVIFSKTVKKDPSKINLELKVKTRVQFSRQPQPLPLLIHIVISERVNYKISKEKVRPMSH